MGAALSIPPMDVTCREHRSPLLSVLAQSDRAALVTPDGHIDTIGVALRPSRSSTEAVDPSGGTRHTSARRFSFDEPQSVVFVVSAAGPMSVFQHGDVIVDTSSEDITLGS
jgi:DNA integrity scanning protein DisA with diadenylate cyclase activity